MDIKEHPEPDIVGNNVLPAYFSDEQCVNQLHKSKSGYFVRLKGWNDGVDKNCNPPTKEGYYFDEYMSQYRLAQSGLPF
jgi:hypothetical protein